MRYALIYPALAACLLAACTKNTTISGTITDKATGLPLEGVAVGMSATKYESESDHTTAIKLGDDHDTTGADGRYFIEISTKRPAEMGFGALKTGYAHIAKSIKWGKDFSFDLELNPIDAVIRINVFNESGDRDKVYALVYSPEEKTFDYVYPWPLILQQGESFTGDFQLTGDQFAQIRWGDTPNQPLMSSTGVHIDSIFCGRKDTTEYLLKL